MTAFCNKFISDYSSAKITKYWLRCTRVVDGSLLPPFYGRSVFNGCCEIGTWQFSSFSYGQFTA